MVQMSLFKNTYLHFQVFILNGTFLAPTLRMARSGMSTSTG